MAVYASAAPPVSGPSADRHAFLKRSALFTLVGLIVAGVVGSVSMVTIAPAVMSIRYGGIVVFIGAWIMAHWVCRKMVYGSAKMAGFIISVLCFGVALGFLLLSTMYWSGFDLGLSIIIQALGLTAATALGMLIYVWFSKGELKIVGAFLTMAFVPMLILMGIGLFFPFGGTFGHIISAAFVLVSAAGLLYRLHYVVHQLDTEQHIEAAYEITMGVLVLLWNIISLLSRLRR